MAAPWWWRYAIPNLLTCVSLSAALLSICSTIEGDLRGAAWLILLCVLLDKADGSAARLVRGSSRFGVEMDSLTDLVAFGVAPAVLVLTEVRHTPAMQGAAWLRYLCYGGVFWFVIGSALRLAKFNVVSDTYGKEHFFGFPTTLCGAFVACFYLVAKTYPPVGAYLPWLPLAMLALGLLMVSRVPLPKVRVQKSIVLNAILFSNVACVYIFGFARIFPEYLLAVSVIYMLLSLVSLARGVRAPALARPGEDAAGSDGGGAP